MPDATSPAIGFSFAVQLDDKKGITAQTHVDQEWGVEAINEVLDKIATVIERQAAKANLAEWKRKLASDEKRLKSLIEDLARLDEQHKAAWEGSGKRGPFKLSTKEEADRRNAESTRDRYAMEIEVDKERIAELEATIGNGS